MGGGEKSRMDRMGMAVHSKQNCLRTTVQKLGSRPESGEHLLLRPG